MEDGQICSEDDFDRLTARNVLLQFDEIRRLASKGWGNPNAVTIDVPTMFRLHTIACADIYNFGGQFRPGGMRIRGSEHIPPPANEVVQHVDQMVDYIANYQNATPIHLCAYILWRCNWIHPFPNANGRTTRGLAYLVFLLRLGYEPGGTTTFMDMIASDKFPYYDALDLADASWKQGVLDVSAMENVVSERLTRQLLTIVSEAGVQLPTR
jgi:Fic family protein